ncbi:hypothetical protein RJ527_04175 [Thalassospiraceae bacterium LMO-SO8]|nr:hypothetical protein [Alphaproteobacteria bacterium LMO-S08]WND76948.1 hypothetical protein RJ527_04175 [Thalassospiraceae bacterium LMO-SO8]
MTVLTLNESAFLGRATQDTLAVAISFDANQAGRVDPETERAIRHVTFLSRPEDNPEQFARNDWDEVVRDHSERILRQNPSRRQHDLFLMYLSGYFHELRHAHDLLGSCCGQDILFLLANCYQNTAYLLNDLKKWQVATGKDIPVPLPPAEQFEALSPDSVTILNKYRNTVENFRGFQRPFGAPYWLTPVDLLEASACNAQLTVLHELFGAENTFRVTELIARSPAANRYLRARNSVADYLASKGFTQVHSDALTYIIWSSLMALKPHGQSMADGLNPVIAFEGIVEVASRHPDVLHLEDAIKAVDAFCSEWDLMTPLEMGEYFTANMDRRLQSKTGGGYEEIRKAHEGLRASFELMLQTVTRHPNGFTNLNMYPWAIVNSALPSVLVRTYSNGEMHDYLSPGVAHLSAKQWTLLDILGCGLRVLSEGFGALGDSNHENMIMEALRNQEDHTFRFRDTFF